MPILNWLGKDRVVNHHRAAPFHFLDKKFSVGSGSGNMIIHGDNLLALKSLLPRYAGRVKCIYIDPPYNTGNEGWIYNDNVNDLTIQRWLGEVVGKEGEDLSRHDKWLCMMYPRLSLLKELLADDGAIFISIDDNELFSLKFVCDEIFGANNFMIQLPRITKRSGKSTEIFAQNHDTLLIYSKSANCKLNSFPHNDEGFKYRDEFFDKRGLYKLNQTLDYDSLQYSDSLDYPLTIDGITYYAGSSHELFLKRKSGKYKRADWAWRWSKEKFQFGLANGFIVVKSGRNGTRIYTKTYQRATIDYDNGEYFIKYIERTAPVSSLVLTANEFSNDNATKVLTSIFGEKIFDYSKPVSLVEFICGLATDKDSIVLDAFAGSGTTAHAVINLNKADGGSRRFILIELMDYAETITAERVKRVGGEFDYYELGAELFDEYGDLNAAAPAENLREYIWYSETHKELPPAGDEKYLLGVDEGTAYYFYYEPENSSVLDFNFLSTIKTRAERYVIYAEACLLSEGQLKQYGIYFRQIPYDVRKY